MTTLTFAGNLASDPELRFTPNGTAVIDFTVIENRRTKNDAGDWIDDIPNTFRVKAWRSLAENLADSLTKGLRVTVTGKLVTEKYHDRDTGDARYSTHIEADDVAVSCKFHTVTATKANRATQEPAE